MTRPTTRRRHAGVAAVRLLLALLAGWLSLAPVASRQLTAIRVPEGGDLQAALDAAEPGSTILLPPGVTFRGNFVLPAHGGSAHVTLRTDADALPGPGTRTGPGWSGRLAIVESPNQAPAIRTAPGSHHWRLENLEVRAAGGSGDVIALGDGGRDQRTLDAVPYSLILDRLYVHGDPLTGHKRGIALNSRMTEITNCHISEIKAIGQDAQAIAGWNGPGSYLIENNYLEASGEVVLFGGADPWIDDLVPTDIVIRRNHLTRPEAWRDDILPAPGGLRATPASAGGTLAAGSYRYSVVAERQASGGRAQSAAASVAVVLSSGSSQVALEWQPVDGAAGYRVFRRPPGGVEQAFAAPTARFLDTGAAGAEGSPRAASVWLVKNLLELKNARNVTIDGNLLERHWRQAQNGYAILFTPRNQDGRSPWSRVENVRFTNNVVRGVGAAINLSGSDDVHPSGRTSGVVIRNNLFLDVDGARWGGNGDFMQVGHGPLGVVVERNTVVHSGRILAVYGSQYGPTVPDLVFRDNVLRHNQYGVIGADAGPGTDTFTRFLPGAVFTGNVIAGGRAASYPRENVFVTAEQFDALFVDRAAGDYRVRPPYAAAGADALSLRAVLAAVAAP